MIRNPMTRLGFNGAAEIKAHPFFAPIDWKNFEKRQPDGGFQDIFPPQRKIKGITKKQKEKAVEARDEIYELLSVPESQRKKTTIDKWSFVRS
jgi:hypothetical protein